MPTQCHFVFWCGRVCRRQSRSRTASQSRWRRSVATRRDRLSSELFSGRVIRKIRTCGRVVQRPCASAHHDIRPRVHRKRKGDDLAEGNRVGQAKDAPRAHRRQVRASIRAVEVKRACDTLWRAQGREGKRRPSRGGVDMYCACIAWQRLRARLFRNVLPTTIPKRHRRQGGRG